VVLCVVPRDGAYTQGTSQVRAGTEGQETERAGAGDGDKD